MAKNKIITTALNILCFRKGYRVLSCIVWFVLFVLVMIPLDNYNRAENAELREKYDYHKRCAEGDFAAAHAIKAKYYADYTSLLGKWRSGVWCDREARQYQERYRAALAYIFSQELSHVYATGSDNRDEKLISLLVAIPSEGSPLTEGEHGNKIFYSNDAGINPMGIDHMVYQSWVRFFNDRCDQVFDIAYSNGNMELAKKVCRLYKTEVNTTFKPDTINGSNYCIGTVTYDNSRRDAAISKCK